MTKFLIFVGLFITLQLAENQYEVIAQSQPVSIQKRSVPSTSPVGGISVEHPLQATVYAYRRGLMKLSVPFEITIVPLAAGGIPYPAVPVPNGYQISGQVKPQQDASHSPYNQNTYRQYPSSQFGPSYYPPASYQHSYSPYNSYNGYNGYNQQYRNPNYGVPGRRIDISRTKPWPQFRPTQQAKPVYNSTANVTQNWSGNNAAMNINSPANNVTHPPNASAQNAITTTTAPETTQSTSTAAGPSTTTTTTTTTTTMPEPLPVAPLTDAPPLVQALPEILPETPQTDSPPLAQVLQEEASYMQPMFMPPNFAPDGTVLPNEMNFNGEYNGQMNGN